MPIDIFYNFEFLHSLQNQVLILFYFLGCESFGVSHSFGEEGCPFTFRRTGEDQNGSHWF